MSSNKIFGIFLGLDFKEDSIIFTFLNNSLAGTTLLSSSAFPFMGRDEDISDMREYINQHGRDVDRIFVSIPDKWAMMKFIQVPSTKGKGTIDQLMSFEIERHIPFNLEDVVYDFQIIEEKDRVLTVVFTAVQKQKINFVREVLDKLSLKPALITTSSFAVLNAIESSGSKVGGWQQLMGFSGRLGILGKKGETNVLLYVDKGNFKLSIIQDGIYRDLKSFDFDSNQMTASVDDIANHLIDLKSSLTVEKYDKLIVSGDSAAISSSVDMLKERLGMNIETVDELASFSRNLEVESKGLAPSIGACLIGIGTGTFRINMLPHKREHHIKKKGPLVAQVLIVIMVLLLVAIAAAEIMGKKKFLENIEAALEKNEPEIAELDQLSSKIDLFEEKRKNIKDIRANELTLDILAELSKMLPKEVWITNLHYKGFSVVNKKQNDAEVVINGFAESSSVLIPLLEDSPYFEKVEFVGPIKKSRDKEGFKLRAKVVNPDLKKQEQAGK